MDSRRCQDRTLLITLLGEEGWGRAGWGEG